MRIAVDRLQGFVEAIARGEGVSAEHAAVFAARVIDADLRGMHGHGVIRLAPLRAPHARGRIPAQAGYPRHPRHPRQRPRGW